ncbi:hypothetical protein DJ568_01620 [Mucilaginibacter hurinus]|uniref:DUF4251 domain-containing protein n=2 Tax=Mucilaginibacter hurinus TaxID=2201324 RepID=A0A367GT41_9SPHI|nr:hypothetical protein DJ568_01620 [Mucilaginibacter hurinus]
MKKYLLILLMLTGGYVHGQSVTFNDLTNLAHLSNQEAYNYLTQARSFKRDYNMKNTSGMQMEGYKRTTPDFKWETVMVGDGTKLDNGALLRNVYYTSNNKQHILGLVTQAGKAGLKLSFKGLDADKNIFIFDSDLYNVSINLNIYNGAGSVTIKQKEVAGIEY